MAGKDFSIRLRLSAFEGEEVKRIALAEGRSQTDVLTRLVRDGFRHRRGEVSEIGKIAQMIRGSAEGFPQ
jgi:hypothetical protein